MPDGIPEGAVDRYLSSTAAERGEGRHEQTPEPERKVCPLCEDYDWNCEHKEADMADGKPDPERERAGRIDLPAWESDAIEDCAKWGNRAHFLGKAGTDALLEGLAESIEKMCRQFAGRCAELKARVDG